MNKIILLLAFAFISISGFAQQGPFLYQVEANWLAECEAETPLVIEDFEGNGLTGGLNCGSLLSSTATNSCFPVGELQDGFTITVSNGGFTFFGSAGWLGANQVIPVVGSSTVGEFTIITFTQPTTRVAFDVFDTNDNMENGIIRVFDTEDTLLETFTVELEADNFKFFGIHSSELIGRIELEDSDTSNGLVFGNLRFGSCRVNDDPNTAIALTVGDVFEDNPVEGNNNFASDSQLIDPTIPVPGCASYNGGDVWFSAIVPESGLLTIETQMFDGGFITDTGLAVYTEDLTEVLDCDDDDGEGTFSLITLADRTPGEIILIRVWEFGGNTFGDFNIAAYDFSPPPNDLIENAIDVDQLGFPYTDSDINFEDATEDIVTNAGCNAALNSVVWYKFTAFADGTVTATFENPTDNTDSLIIFFSADNENATNDNLTFVNSGTNVCANANNHTDISIEAIAGQTYYVLVNSIITSTIVIDSADVLNTDETTIEDFSFYPNPVEDFLNIKSRQTIDQITMYNITGQQVLDQKIQAMNTQITVGDLSSGIYLMTITSGNKIATHKFIKQ